MNRQKYSIGEMSELLGVTTHMLRHYEKMGIIHPETNPENGYRYYSVLDTRRFNLSRELLACGIPLEQGAKLMTDMKPDEIDQLISQTIEMHKRQIVKSQIAIEVLKDKKENWETKNSLGRVWVENLPQMWRLNLSQNEKAVLTPELIAQRQEWLDCMPAVYWASRMPRRSLLGYEKQPVYYEYGLVCKEQHALQLGLKKSRDVDILPGGDYLVTVHEKKGDQPFIWQHISPLMDYINRENIQVYGDAYAHIIASRMENGLVVNYHRVILKIYS